MFTEQIKTYLVIPAYNEGKNIKIVLDEALAKYPNVVVVDDGSIDNTAEVINATKATLLRHVTNRGQGAALRTGTKFAFASGADIVVHFDADGQFLVDDIELALKPLIAGEANMALGSRFINNTTEMPWFKEYAIMPMARLFNQVFFGLNLTDPQSGFRAFNASAFDKILWQQDGMAHCTEILHLAAKNKITIVEVPITVIYHHFGQRLSGGFKIIKDFIIYSLIN